MSTSGSLPGMRVKRVLGIHFGIASSAMWTAATKMRRSLVDAYRDLRFEARQAGANAIIDVRVATAGAHGGVTNVVGGDAISVVVYGTAVVAEPE